MRNPDEIEIALRCLELAARVNTDDEPNTGETATKSIIDRAAAFYRFATKGDADATAKATRATAELLAKGCPRSDREAAETQASVEQAPAEAGQGTAEDA